MTELTTEQFAAAKARGAARMRGPRAVSAHYDRGRNRVIVRLTTGVEPVPLTERPLTFEPVDREAFPAVDLAYRVGGLGLTFPAVMNAANEVAVMAFLEGKIPLTRIVDVVQTAVDEHEPASIVSVVNIERADAWARHRAAEIIEER